VTFVRNCYLREVTILTQLQHISQMTTRVIWVVLDLVRSSLLYQRPVEQCNWMLRRAVLCQV